MYRSLIGFLAILAAAIPLVTSVDVDGTFLLTGNPDLSFTCTGILDGTDTSGITIFLQAFGCTVETDPDSGDSTARCIFFEDQGGDIGFATQVLDDECVDIGGTFATTFP